MNEKSTPQCRPFPFEAAGAAGKAAPAGSPAWRGSTGRPRAQIRPRGRVRWWPSAGPAPSAVSRLPPQKWQFLFASFPLVAPRIYLFVRVSAFALPYHAHSKFSRDVAADRAFSHGPTWSLCFTPAAPQVAECTQRATSNQQQHVVHPKQCSAMNVHLCSRAHHNAHLYRAPLQKVVDRAHGCLQVSGDRSPTMATSEREMPIGYTSRSNSSSGSVHMPKPCEQTSGHRFPWRSGRRIGLSKKHVH